MKVLVVGESKSPSYYKPFSAFGKDEYESEILWKEPSSVNLVVFTGGADVSPALYGQEAAPGTFTAPKRDIFECVAFEKARSLGLRMAGICRGAQLLNVMAGGKLIQHLDNHTVYHPMTTVDGEEFEVSSTHHQMMVPPEESLLLAWSTKHRSRVYVGQSLLERLPPPERETEAVYWPKLRAVGFQYHPETMSEHSRGFRFAGEAVRKYLF